MVCTHHSFGDMGSPVTHHPPNVPLRKLPSMVIQPFLCPCLELSPLPVSAPIIGRPSAVPEPSAALSDSQPITRDKVPAAAPEGTAEGTL